MDTANPLLTMCEIIINIPICSIKSLKTLNHILSFLSARNVASVYRNSEWPSNARDSKTQVGQWNSSEAERMELYFQYLQH